jgi:hypothetical protein
VSTSTMTALVQAARDAAGEAADLKRQAARIDPYIPLAVWPAPLHELDLALSSVSNGLYRASHLASDAIGQNPALPKHGATPGALAIASTRASTAADHANGTLNAIRRELRRAGLAPDISPNPLSRHAAYTAGCLSKLDEALLAARRSGDPDLAALAVVARRQSAILADLSHTCDRFHYGIAEACERTPKATTSKTTRISGPLRRASVTLKKAAAIAAHAADDLDDELIWARRRGDVR